jgi:hypothetical protein
MIRRSQRKNIDTSKPMIIVRPDSDARMIFDIKSDFEWEQFQSAMEEDHSGDWSDEDEDDNHGNGNIKLPFPSSTVAGFEKAEVMTPSVKISTSFLQQSPRQQQQQQQHFDFDLNKKETPLKISPPFNNNTSIINSIGNMSSFATPVANPNPTHFNYHYYAFSSTPNGNNIGGNQSPFVSQTTIPSNSSSSSYYFSNNNPSFYDFHPYKSYSDSYFDYDLNQEDMNYYDSMKQKLLTSNTFENYLLQKEFLTCMNEIMNYRIFELLMIRLEKEMELILLFAQSRSQCEEHSSSLEALLEQSNAFVDNYLNNFITSIGKGADEKVKQQSKTTNSNVVSVIPSSSSSAATTTEDLTTLPTENHNCNNNNNGITSKTEESNVDETREKGVVCGDLASLQGLLDYYHSSQQQLQQKEQQQQQQLNYNNTNNNNATSSRFSTDENDTPRTHASTTTPTAHNNNNNNCNESSFTKEELHKLFPKEQALKLLLPIIYRFIIEKNSFRYLTNSLSSGNHNNNNNYNHSAMNNNSNNNRQPYKQKIGGEIEIDWNLLDSKYFQTIQSFCVEIHDYWTVLRVDQSSKSASFLRGFHNYIMPLWQRCAEANVPSIQEFGKDSFLSSHQQLHTIRDDLNRTRTIVDRVRRREKLKKDLFKCSNENLLLNILYYNNSSAVVYQDQLASPAGALRTRSDSFLWSGQSQQNHHLLSNTPKNFLITGKQQRSMSLLSEASGFLSNEGNTLGIAGGGASNLLLPPRKRGRPRRVDPNSIPIGVSSELVNDHANSDGHNNNNNNNSINSGPLDPLQVAFIQGRDKFGKFLKKQPTVVASGLSHYHYFQQQPQQHQQYRDFHRNEESCYSNQSFPENNRQNAEEDFPKEKDPSTELDDQQQQTQSAINPLAAAGLSIQNPSSLILDSDSQQQQPLQIQVGQFSNNHHGSSSSYYNSPNPNPQSYHHQQYQKKRMEEELISKDRDVSIRSIRFTLCNQDDDGDEHDENDGYVLKDETEASKNKQMVKKTTNINNNSTAVSVKSSNSNPNSHNTSGKSNKSESMIVKKSPRIQNKKSAAAVLPKNNNNNSNSINNSNKKTRPKQQQKNNHSNTKDHSESNTNNHKVEEEENDNDNDSDTTISCNSGESLSLFSSSASSLLLSSSNNNNNNNNVNKTADLPSGL